MYVVCVYNRCHRLKLVGVGTSGTELKLNWVGKKLFLISHHLLPINTYLFYRVSGVYPQLGTHGARTPTYRKKGYML